MLRRREVSGEEVGKRRREVVAGEHESFHPLSVRDHPAAVGHEVDAVQCASCDECSVRPVPGSASDPCSPSALNFDGIAVSLILAEKGGRRRSTTSGGTCAAQPTRPVEVQLRRGIQMARDRAICFSLD